MLDSKFFFTLVGLVVAVFAVCNTNIAPPLSEDFDNGCGFKEIRSDIKNGFCGGNNDFQNNYKSVLNNGKGYPFVSYPNMLSPLSPRATSVSYSGNITYNMPDYKNLAVPRDPLDMASMVQENYEGKCVSNYKKGDYSTSEVKRKESDKLNIDGNGMAVVDMNTINLDSAIYERAVNISRIKRFNGPDDLIRGASYIQPIKTGWFDVSSSTIKELPIGAMQVFSGNSTDFASYKEAKIASAFRHN